MASDEPSRMKRFLICGGRKFSDKVLLAEALMSLKRKYGMFLMIHGDCETGADKMADDWAKFSGIDRIRVPANWTGRDKAGGPFRNQLMLDLFTPDGVIAFPGGDGTADMVNRAHAARIKVWQIVEKDY
jgi:hypothetical protein